jgi:hypothetical protein
MAKSGSLILYQQLILGGAIKSSTIAMSGTSYQADLSKTTFNWTVVNQDIVNNRSTINWTLTVENLKNYSLTSFTIDELYIDDLSLGYGVRIYSNETAVNIDLDSSTAVYSGTLTFNHKADGTLSMPLRIKAYMRAQTASSTYYSNSAIDNELTISPDNIPRHAVLLSAPEKFTDEDSPTITFAIPNGATNVKAYITFNTSTIDIGSYPVSGDSHTFNFTGDEKKKLWSILDQGLNTKPMYFYVTSEYLGELYHSGPIISTLEVINYKPIINSEINDIYDTNEKSKLLTGDPHKLIRYVSNAYYNIGAEARKGATIESVSIKNGNLTKYSSTGTFEGVTSPDFVYTATDSRGTSIPSTTTRFEESTGYWIPYVKLTCSSEVTEMTADGDVAVTLKGMFFNGNFSASKQNRLRMSYDLYKNDEVVELNKDWGYIDRDSGTNASTGNPAYFTYDAATSTYTYEFTIPGLDYMGVYELFIRVSDEVAVEGVEAQTIIASTPIFDWGRTDFNFNVPVNVEGDLTVAGNITAGGNTVPTIVAQGTAGIWTYRTWSDGTAECWGKKDVSVTFPSTANWGSLYTTGAISASNVSFPYGLFAETPVVNASLLIRSVGGILMAPGGNDSNKATWDQTGVYEIARGWYVSGTQYYTINYDVKGRWK